MYSLTALNAEDWLDWRNAFEYICGIIVDESAAMAPIGSSVTDSPRLQPIDGKSKLPTKLKLTAVSRFEGTMLKLGNDCRGKYRERHFKLIGTSLFYFAPNNLQEPLANIPLSIATLGRPVGADQGNQNNAFELTVNNG